MNNEGLSFQKHTAGASNVAKKKQASKATTKLKTEKSVLLRKKSPESKTGPEKKILAKPSVAVTKMPVTKTAENPDSPSKKKKRGKRSKTGETLVKPVKKPKKTGGKQIFNKAGKKGAAAANQSLKRQQARAAKLNRGVVYFSHLPHGFYEDQLKGYCSQFGKVTGVYVPRSQVCNNC